MMNKVLNNKKGFTLVEMIVSLTILTVLMLVSMQMISFNLNVYNKNRIIEQSDIVAEYLLTSIENELSNVTGGSVGNRLDIVLGIAKKNNVEYGEGIQYYDKDGRKSCIYVDDRHLVFHKYAITNTDGLVDEDGTVVTGVSENAKDTLLPVENYKGFKIESLTCSTSMYYRMFSSSFTVTVNIKNDVYNVSYSKGMTIDSFNEAFIRGPYVLLGNLGDSTERETFTID